MNDPKRFPYDLAFDRNIGLITDWEQLALRARRVAIAGMGGAGGGHLLTLARLGIGAFSIADFDQFEFANFNRQAGANVATIGRDKATVMHEMALAINPELRIRRFDAGVTTETIDDFLRDADLFIDGLDFFALKLRRQVFARCAERGIPAVTAAPIGMGVAFIAFDPKGMSFEQYFRFEGRSEQEQYVRFLLGLTPRAFHRGYLVDPTRVDLERRKGPSTIIACQLCASVTATAALKLLLGRGNVMPAPCNHQFDAYAGRSRVTRLRFGNDGPLQRLKIAVGRRLYRKFAASGVPKPDPPATPRSPIEEILNLALWTPSGDNRQPWSLRIMDAETVRLTIRFESDNIYEYRDGEPTLLAIGCLIETMRIAATGWQRDMVWSHDPADARDAITVRFPPAVAVAIDPLLAFITLRSVDRRRFQRRALTEPEKAELKTCLTGGLMLDWHERLAERWRIARLSARATGIRLRSPEAFRIHCQVIDWDRALSPTGIPAKSVGLSRLTLPLMRWAMANWQRARWLNRLGGVLTAALQLDLLPGLGCAGYFVMRRPPGKATAAPAELPAELIEMGRGIQRFWLTASRLGLAMQPILAAVAFAHYGEQQMHFSSERRLLHRAASLAKSFRHALDVPAEEVVFIGRIGEPVQRLPMHRSVRRPLAELLE
jgi:sulfur-carrier protein adenylyltransferase/sulfurtransferase